MNDFTKEELERLLSDHWSCGANHCGLYEKLQSMITNYDKPCEHTNLRRVKLLNGHEYDICASCEFIRQAR